PTLPRAAARSRVHPPSAVGPARGAIADDRTDISKGERVLLIIEDDQTFAQLLLEHARAQGFRAIVALTGQEGLELAQSMKPDAITLDLRLPDMDGWVLFDRLKRELETRHIPIHIISAAMDERRGLEQGAIAVLHKPLQEPVLDQALQKIQQFLDRRVKRLLVVEDDKREREAIVDLIGNGDVETVAVESGERALACLLDEPFDCMVLDLSLPDMSGLELIRRIRENRALHHTPVIVYTGKELDSRERHELDQLAQTVIIKDVRSPERLLEETSLFLHRVESSLPERGRTMLRSLVHGDPALEGKSVLVVDDDVRNIFAITALLEQHAMKVQYAENGHAALKRLEELDEVDVVLMDIMMPEMDGYEAMRRIRAQDKWRKLPIIALTAKAMRGDRERCIEAGASDYVTKPVDPEQLISLLRVWLYQ